jgi:multidrug resistance efflux pump
MTASEQLSTASEQISKLSQRAKQAEAEVSSARSKDEAELRTRARSSRRRQPRRLGRLKRGTVGSLRPSPGAGRSH